MLDPRLSLVGLISDGHPRPPRPTSDGSHQERRELTSRTDRAAVLVGIKDGDAWL